MDRKEVRPPPRRRGSNEVQLQPRRRREAEDGRRRETETVPTSQRGPFRGHLSSDFWAACVPGSAASQHVFTRSVTGLSPRTPLSIRLSPLTGTSP